MSMKPLAIDLYAGLGGWTEGLLAEGWEVIGFDIERHQYGDAKYPAQLVLQDVLTLHGSQFRDADLIVASPPCQAYSYRAMPWSRAKALPPPDNSLFEACFRIQREAIEAAGHFIPLVVENVRGAQKWVGRARWNFGSFYLWGDVPALMPMVSKRAAFKGGDRNIGRANGEHRWNTEFKLPGNNGPKRWEDRETQRLCDAYKSSGMNWSDRTKRGQDFTRIAGQQAIKNNGGSWFNIAHNTTSGKGQNPDGRKVPSVEGRRTHVGKGTRFTSEDCSKSNARKAASAVIAKIPFALARHVAQVWKPRERMRAA